MLSVAILGGTGHQGGGLAQRFAGTGVQVTVGTRDPNRARQEVASWSSAPQSIEVRDNADAVRRHDLIVLAVPFPAVDTLLAELHPHFREGSTLIDVTVPLAFSKARLEMLSVAEGSAAEHVRARLPRRVKLAIAFKTIPALLLGDVMRPLDCDEFVCGDSDEARAAAMTLVKLLPGLRPIDVGPISRARFIEQLTAMAVAINRRHKLHDARFRVVGFP